MRQPRRLFARKGETCTCESGHPIFDFARNVYFGDIPGDHHTTRWRQKRLKKGDPIPNCKICGHPFVRNLQPFGMMAHFADGWRGAQVDLGSVVVAEQAAAGPGMPSKAALGTSLLPMFGMFGKGKPH